MMHYDESKHEPHTAQRLEIASMFRVGGELIPSDIRGTTARCLNKEARLSRPKV
jgi:hypothetical protein